MFSPLLLSQLHSHLLAQGCKAELLNGDVTFTGVSTDTRSLVEGDLYVAISGERFDGHDFVAAAVEKGCCAVVVDHEITDIAVPQLVVTNTVTAYGQIAALNRQQFTKPLFSITGSCGKTTVKEMLVNVLNQQGNVHATVKNFNNHIGVPAMLLALEPQHDFSVMELGASGVGEIQYLAGLTKADVALVTNVQPAHVEGFGSVDAIAQEKSEIYRGMQPAGVAVINLDDHYAASWLQEFAQKRVITFSCEKNSASVYASDIKVSSSGQASFMLHIQEQEYPVSLRVLGQHNVNNALAVAAMAHAVGVEPTVIVSGLESFAGVPGRLAEYKTTSGHRVIDDTYNANPGSVKAAIDFLAKLDGVRILVLGDMGELGADAGMLHDNVGSYAKEKHIDVLFTVGDLSAAATQGFGESAKHFTDKSALIAELQVLLASIQNAAILVKGSRSTSMEDVVNEIKEKGNR